MKKLCIVFLGLVSAAGAFGQTTRTITNQDLEKYRWERVESERKLNQRNAALGITSADLERQAAERQRRMEEYADRLREDRLNSENDLARQADALRTQLISVEAQINYLRSQGNYSSNQTYYSSYGYAPFYGDGYTTYGGRGGNRSPLAQLQRLPPNMRTVQEYAAMYPSSQGLFRQSTGNVIINGGGYSGGRSGGGRGYYRGGYIAPVVVGGAVNSGGGDSQIVYLEQQRAGLLAQWSLLEEKARRAGIRLD